MMNIDELALKVGATHYSPAPMRAVKGWSFTFEQLQALIAEHEAAGSEPVGYYSSNYGTWYEPNYKDYSNLPADAHPVFLRPDPRVVELEAEATKWKEGYRKEFLSAIDWAGRHQILHEQVAELEAQLKTALGVIDKIDDTYEEKIAALLVAIEAKDAAILANHEWHKLYDIYDGYIESDLASTNSRALSISFSTELLEARDRKRDAKLLDLLSVRLHNEQKNWVRVAQLAAARLDGSWKPELGD